jgi:hypothetical protein
MRSSWHRRLCHQCERAKIPFEVTDLKVVVPLTLALDGEAVVFPFTLAVEQGHHDAPYQHMRCARGMSADGAHATDGVCSTDSA